MHPAIPQNDLRSPAPKASRNDDRRARIAVVIVTFNGARWLSDCLGALASQSPVELIIVDNASADDTLEHARRIAPQATVVENSRNIGFGAANNLGIARALEQGADFVFLMNQDIVLRPRTLDRLAVHMHERSEFAMLSALQLDYDGKAIDRAFRRYLSRTSFVDDLFFGRENGVYEVPFAPAAAVLVRTRALEQVGGFDPLFFMYGEDKDLCRRITSAGWKIGIAADAVALHWHGLFERSRTFAWRVNFLYSRLLLHIKSSRRSPLRALASSYRYCHPGASLSGHCAWLCSAGRCLLNLRRIGRHRRSIPHVFDSKGSADTRCES